MRTILTEIMKAAIQKARALGDLQGDGMPAGLTVEVPKVASHGDWSTNAAMVMAKTEKKPPRELTDILIRHIEDPDGYIDNISVAGPGFINFSLSRKWWESIVRDILSRKEDYGRGDLGRGRKVQVEFVSANPTGPLHVGHGRGAALGDSLARILAAAGYTVQKEYYINDAGVQMQTLGRSVLYRYFELWGRSVDFPENFYQGDYIRDLAMELKNRRGDEYLGRPEDESVEAIYPWAAGRILEGMKADLEAFKVHYDRWFSEKSLYEDGQLEETLKDLKTRGHIYEKDGASWFAATAFNDEKDRVLVKSTGEKTYFATDIAYHRDKFGRGFDLVINLWGADHHGYVARMKSAVEALGYRRDQLEVLLVQLVNLLRGGVPVAMTTRGGIFDTLREVVDEVGVDVARFIFLTRSADSPLDFDLEAAKSHSADNPVHYIHYAHARLASVFKKAAEKGMALPGPEEADLSLLVEEAELTLMKHMAGFPDAVAGAAKTLEPHRLASYLTDLAKKFHPFYNNHRIIGQDRELSKSRLVLSQAVKQTLANGLNLLGVSAPEKM